MLKVSQTSRYAVHALLFLANAELGFIRSDRIAQACGLPEIFLLKVLKELTRAGLLHSLKGPHGGYRMAKPPREVSLLDIVEIIDGSLQTQIQGVQVKEGQGVQRRLQAVLDRAVETVRRQLQRVKLTHLVEEGKRAKA